MKKKRYVLPVDHLPSRAPVWQTLMAYMAIDYYHAPGWVAGVVGTVFGICWIGWAVIFFGQQEDKPMVGYGESEK